MGALGWTSFCKNGHIVEQCEHHQIIHDEQTHCRLCGEPVICSITEWGDEEYGPFNVPATPIGHEMIQVITESRFGRKEEYHEIPVYDVSKVKI